MSLLFELGPNLKTQIDNLQPTPGYCIFIDSVGSTALKDNEPRVWLSRLHDIFALAKAYLKEFQPLKTIGDALMYYIPETEMKAKNQKALDLHLGLCFLVQEKTTEVFGRTKAAIAHCQEAYCVTFVPGTEDIYGKDIDLTARLLSIAQPGEIMMNERFATQVVAEYKVAPAPGDIPDVEKIMGPWRHRFKGFTNDVNIYKSPIGGTSLKKHLPSHYDGVFY
jgi:class 3 adenylate cyclase